MIRALIFDFDGLILETESPEYHAWVEVFAEHGSHLPLEDWTHVIGRHNTFFNPLDDLERRIGRVIDREAAARRRRDRHAELMAQEVVRPGVAELIAEAAAAGLRLAVASSSSRAWVGGNLDRLGLLGHFDCLRCRDDVQRAKPDPDLYLAALSCLGLTGTEAIAIEDSPNGIAAARAAGLACVAVPNPMTEALDLSQASAMLPTLAGVTLARLISLVESP